MQNIPIVIASHCIFPLNAKHGNIFSQKIRQYITTLNHLTILGKQSFYWIIEERFKYKNYVSYEATEKYKLWRRAGDELIKLKILKNRRFNSTE